MKAQAPEWRDVIGFEGLYRVSDDGKVWSVLRSQLVKASPDNARSLHPTVNLARDGKRYRRRVHVLMLEAFVGPRPTGALGCHDNDIATDNRIANLRWDTHEQNQRDAVRNGRHPEARRTHCDNGHEFADNARFEPSAAGGRRACRRCQRDATSRYRARKKVAA